MPMKQTVLFFILVFNISLASKSQDMKMADSSQYLASVKKELQAVWPKNRTINLVFHGHSVVAGYQDKHEVHTFGSYPFLLLKKLKKKYPYAVINVIITAIGGENSVQGQKRFEKDVLTYQADVLFIDYALNDRGPGLEKAKEAWKKMIEAALNKNIKIILLTPSPDERVDILSPGNPLELHANQIRELAMKYHIGLSDSFSQFQKVAKEGGNIKDYMAMFVHPNKKGNDIIADELMKWFE
jgi:lysophospholipase L1-like esterase